MKSVILTETEDMTRSRPSSMQDYAPLSGNGAKGAAYRLYPEFLDGLLPPRLTEAIRRVEKEEAFCTLEEIRLRRACDSLCRSEKGTHRLSVTLTGREMDDTLSRMAGGSLYAHEETLREGYLTLEGGVRVGVCGRAAVEEGRVVGVYDPSALVVRIPGRMRLKAGPVLRLVKEARESGRGILIYAPPGEGKTTLLRSLILDLGGARVPFRVAVVDSRGELSVREDARVTADLLVGYPRGVGMEIAVRTLCADLVICDEIGSVLDAEEILPLQHAGVPLLATAHGKELSDLLRRPGIRLLHEEGVFGHYVGIARSGGRLSYEINTWEEADAVL